MAPIGSRRQSLTAGFLAGGVALAVLLLWRLVTGRPGFLEAISDGFLRFLPLELFDLAVETLGPLAKGLLYAGIAAAVVIGGGLFGVLAAKVRFGGASSIVDALLIAAGAFLVAGLVALPIFQAGFFGADLGLDPMALHVPLALASLGYGAVLVGQRDGWAAAASPTMARPDTPGADTGVLEPPPGVARRTFLGRTLALLGLGALGASALAILENLARASRPLTGGGPVGGDPNDPFGPTPALTAVGTFYQVNKDLLATTVDGATWRLRVDGLVDRPHDWTLDEIMALPPVEGYRTLECISFVIIAGDDLIGNQVWKGVPIKVLLDRAGIAPTATHVLWEAADGYTESLPLEVALDDESWIAYEMGGAPLTVEHGYPARVMIPGRFGMKQPKWVTRLQLADHDEPGYWEQRGWDRDAIVRTMSRIDRPAAGDTVQAGTPFTATGVAYSGDRGIARVELSPDDGATWLAAELEDITEAPLGPLTWVRWRVPVTIPAAGSYRLVVRATDGAGMVQESATRSSLPSGSTGWHAARISAVG
jgi:DMSO/TMAO reductase YedYZ molybdopterin-dependent catalytic subunit